ncbi:hypothetical protein [Allorhodopirellula heiligendammensis]|uniref:Uncharacterized protein n=1 Tax=Allorhodopirellula heiligendammensis TaxID=2714739 RepID=A0A5C6BXA2_9BACT|nr:hypothetical protein [Allorhodopirellula heiligendammensis]TWU16940.1 hypothetical protein Poly21_41490 [Allorhodopirellula heiligendammensis]
MARSFGDQYEQSSDTIYACVQLRQRFVELLALYRRRNHYVGDDLVELGGRFEAEVVAASDLLVELPWATVLDVIERDLGILATDFTLTYSYDAELMPDAFDVFPGSPPCEGSVQSSARACQDWQKVIDVDRAMYPGWVLSECDLFLDVAKATMKNGGPSWMVLGLSSERESRLLQLNQHLLKIVDNEEVGTCHLAQVARIPSESPSGAAISRNLLDSITNWLQLPQKDKGPTKDQGKLVKFLIESGGRAKAANISTGCGFDWEDPRDGCRKMIKRLRTRLMQIEQDWDVLPEDRGEVALVSKH